MNSKRLFELGNSRLREKNPILQELKRYQQENSQAKLVPERWEDFVKLCTIRSGGNMVQFTPYHYQKLLSDLMDRYSNLIVAKSRQLGTTQLVVSKHLHRACLNPANVSMAFMRNGDDAGAVSRRARQMLQGLKDYVSPENENVGFLKLRGLGELHFKNSSREGSRSYDSVVDFLFDECAFSPNIEQIYSASSPSTALAGDAITKVIVSTPSAKSGWYWGKLSENNGDSDIEEICNAVAAGELYKDELPGFYWFEDDTNACKVVIHWRCHPVYSQNADYLQYRMQQDGTDLQTILREYDLRFVDAAISVFSHELVRKCATGDFDTTVDQDARYYIGLDCATTGADYLSAIILKEKNNKYSVPEIYRKRNQTSQYHLYQIGDLIEKYQPETVGVEVTGGVGQVYLEQLSKQSPKTDFLAIRTTADSKPMMISALLLAMEQEILEYPEKSPITEELLNFRRQGSKLEAAQGKHDDCVMSLCFALVAAKKEKDEPIIDLMKLNVGIFD